MNYSIRLHRDPGFSTGFVALDVDGRGEVHRDRSYRARARFLVLAVRPDPVEVDGRHYVSFVSIDCQRGTIEKARKSAALASEHRGHGVDVVIFDSEIGEVVR